MRLTPFLFLVLLPAFMQAQSIRYSNFYDSDDEGAEIFKEAVVLENSSLLVVGGTANSEVYPYIKGVNEVVNQGGVSESSVERASPLGDVIPKAIVKLSESCNVYEAGYFCDFSVPSPGYCDFYLAKLNQMGDTLFTKVYERPDTSDFVLDIVQTRPNKLMLIGWTYGETTNADADLMFLTVDTLGNELNRVVWGGPGTDFISSGLTIDSLGHVIMVGYTGSFPNVNNGRSWVVKTDSIGNVLWQKTYSGIGSATANGIRADMLSDGNIIISGGKSGDGYLQKIDTAGNEIWIKLYNVPESQGLWDVKELSDGSIVSCGVTIGNDDSQAGWLIKTDSNGDTLWTRTYNPSSLIDFIRFMLVMPNGDIVMLGDGRSPGEVNQDGWILRVDSMGCEVEGCFSVGIEQEQLQEASLSVYPNPVKDVVNVRLSDNSIHSSLEITITDLLGREVLRLAETSLRNTIDVSTLKRGIYLLRTIDEDGTSSSVKFVKE